MNHKPDTRVYGFDTLMVRLMTWGVYKFPGDEIYVFLPKGFLK